MLAANDPQSGALAKTGLMAGPGMFSTWTDRLLGMLSTYLEKSDRISSVVLAACTGTGH